MDRTSVVDDQCLLIRRQTDELVRRFEKGLLPFEKTRVGLQELIEAKDLVKPKLSLAEKRRDKMKEWYAEKGFKLDIPIPEISNREMRHRKDLGDELFFRPATHLVSLKDLRIAVLPIGASWDHGIVQTLVLDLETKGYWFWMNVNPIHSPEWAVPFRKASKKCTLPFFEEVLIASSVHGLWADQTWLQNSLSNKSGGAAFAELVHLHPSRLHVISFFGASFVEAGDLDKTYILRGVREVERIGRDSNSTVS